MQARQHNNPQPRRAQQQQRAAQNLWLKSLKPAVGNASRYGAPHAQLYQASGVAPGAASLQEGGRYSGFQMGHGTGTGHLPMADAMMSGTPPSDTSPEDLMNTMNQLKYMIERMRQEKGQEDGQPLSDLHSASHNGAPTAARYDNQNREIEHLRKEIESCKKEMTAVQHELKSVRGVTKQLEEADDSLKRMTTESLESLRDQLSMLLNTCPLPEDDPFAYPPLSSA
ncbi:hypothetical protein NQ176_g7038 [Zarea fungicola]|uniref:Uncharacterized protein n=1 Tax=Zarea fungicola TaxID=93591 RepID=A0ACC1N2I5_9HYPO|nr:hypothetical protein NQ176_g7038 [Lecanicillium fungicola]